MAGVNANILIRFTAKQTGVADLATPQALVDLTKEMDFAAGTVAA